MPNDLEATLEKIVAASAASTARQIVHSVRQLLLAELAPPAFPTERAKGKPFVKWVGGKRELLAAILAHVPANFGSYFEPFVGGGALFFHLAPGRAILGDSNERLIRTYRGVQRNVDQVMELLRSYPLTKSFYLEMRSKDIDVGTDVEVAAWFIYLNKTGYNGLYRVNSRNLFNVPYGAHAKPNTCDEPTLRACAGALAGVTLSNADFEEVAAAAVPGDLVYFDPPYVPLSISSKFTSYTASGFGSAEQERLRDVALHLKRRGVHVLLSNSATPLVESLYGPHFDLIPILARRSVNSDARGRGRVQEYLIK